MRAAPAELSERRAGRLAGWGRSSDRYRRRKIEAAELRERLKKLAAERRRYGYRRLTVLLKRAGEMVNHKRIDRLYREEGLTEREAAEEEADRGGGTAAFGAPDPDEPALVDGFCFGRLG